MSFGYPLIEQQVQPCQQHDWAEPTTIVVHKCACCGAVERVPNVPVKKEVKVNAKT